MYYHQKNIVYFFVLIVITRIIPVICSSKSLYGNYLLRDFSHFLPPRTIPLATSFTILKDKNSTLRS